MDQKADQLRMVQGALEEKRTELLKTETQLREMEEKYYSSSVTVQDQVVQDLRVSNNVNWMDFTCWLWFSLHILNSEIEIQLIIDKFYLRLLPDVFLAKPCVSNPKICKKSHNPGSNLFLTTNKHWHL